MCGRFESRFKQCDESSVNDLNPRARGKLRLSTQVPISWGFLPIDQVPLTVAISSPLTIAAGPPQRIAGCGEVHHAWKAARGADLDAGELNGTKSSTSMRFAPPGITPRWQWTTARLTGMYWTFLPLWRESR
jgi:hypothetical protein